jgi:hypothetical protein
MIKSANDVLEHFLNALKSKSHNTLLNYLTDEGLLEYDFETRYVTNWNENTASFSNVNMVKVSDGYHIAFLEIANCPHKIEITGYNGRRIKSFTFLCAGCFGEYNDCGVCGGSGWGVL